MFPVALDLTRIPVLLTGYADLLVKRLAYLDEAGASQVLVVCAKANDALRAVAGARLEERTATEEDVKACTVLLVAGVKRERAEQLQGWAKAAGKLINVEDVSDLCDFYFTANVRRGDLVIAVSTSGASPTLARKLRDTLAHCFGAEWAGRVKEIAQFRQELRAKGADMHESMTASEAFLQEKGWLCDRACQKDGKAA
jgi:precorrin-2 dehydrogenase/sirohydrochlorin ferrochelatase